MTEIKRYEMNHKGLPEPDDKGVWMFHEDHASIVAALQEQALAAENVAMRSAINQTIGWQESVDPSNTESVRMLIELTTPATDAAIREIRAHELDDIAGELAALDTVGSTGAIAHLIWQKAAQIRAGEQP